MKSIKSPGLSISDEPIQLKRGSDSTVLSTIVEESEGLKVMTVLPMQTLSRERGRCGAEAKLMCSKVWDIRNSSKYWR